MVGGESLRLDRPGLVVREPANWQQQPLKIIYTTMPQAEVAGYFPDDNSVMTATASTAGEWQELLLELGKRDITALLLEGGGNLAAAALKAGIVDEVEFHIAPKILTGRNSRSVVSGSDPLKLAEALNLDKLTVKRAGADLLISGKIKYEE